MPTATRQNPTPRPRPQPPKQPPNSNGNKIQSRASSPKEEPAAKGGLSGTSPFTIVHYGPPGVGKTSMWAYLPKVGYIYDSKEEGIMDLVEAHQVPKPYWTEEVDSWQGSLDVLARIANQETGIQNLVIDSITGFEQLCFMNHCIEHFNNDWSKDGFLAFQQGPKGAAKTDWPEFLDTIDGVRKSGINVVVIGHSTVKKINNPDGEDYDQFMPDIDRATWTQTTRWAKAILFQNFDITLEKKGLKTKASGGESRLMYTTPAAAYIAKNRWGLEPIIDLGGTPKESFDAFCKAYRKAFKK